ncbi:hypothetical protein [Polynucleobacter sp. UB-Siik-W21]|uniref:hypothetical protein n=1 Tax=Polynucleobacter sp. UB-Siik-W21 TaxID=1855646 RepID=UPI001BFEE630|nr:hypothetical protein [Polynucleobacter sp. UB-Siik-W21]QWD70723.1 hypothetical protein C2756_01725 [Polynucleobacter sp. UB-Siik-W21]
MDYLNFKNIKLLLTIIVSSFLIYLQEYFIDFSFYLYYIELIILTLYIYKFGIIDYRVGLFIFIVLYSVPIIYDLRFNSCQIIDELGNGEKICNKISENFFYIINYLNAIQLALISCLINISSYIKFDSNKKYHLKIIDISLLIVFSFLFNNLNWELINESYNLEGISNLVIVFYILSIRMNDCIKKYNKILIIAIYIFLCICFMKIGSRQFILWALIYFFICYKLRDGQHFPGIKMNEVILGLPILFILSILSTLVVIYRDKGNLYHISIEGKYGIFEYYDLFVRLFYAETTYTFYNLTLVIDYLKYNNSIGAYGLLSDIFMMLIPNSFISDKYSYINSYNIANINELTPYGTWFVPGEFALYFGSPFFVYLTFYLYLYLINYFVRISIYKKSISSVTSYALMYVFASIYIVRGSFIGGFKIYISLIILVIILNFIEKKFNHHYFGIPNN